MTTPRATSIGLFRNPKSPQSNKSNKGATPGSNRSFNPKENVPSPRRSKFFDTIKSLTVRGKQRVETGTPGLKPLGRRKSAWDLFSRKTRKDGSSLDYSSSAEVQRARSVSPSKEIQRDVPSQKPLRRKSLGDIFGTITNKVTSKYNTISQHHVPVKNPEPSSDVHIVDVGPATVPTTIPVARKLTPTLSLHLPSANSNLSEIGPDTVMVEIVGHSTASQNAELLNARDSPQTSPSSSTWSASDTVTLHGANLTVKEAKGERTEFRANTPDEYLQDLIEAHCGSSDEMPSYGTATTASSSSKYQLNTVLGALYKDYSQSSNLADRASNTFTNMQATESTSAMLTDPSMLEFQSFLSRDRRPTIEIREVDSTTDTDIPMSPLYGSQAGDDGSSTSYFSTPLPLDNQKYTEKIRLTLAKMTKNYHSRSSGSDDTSFERNEEKAWEAIVIGDKMMNSGPSYSKPTTIPSPKDQSKNERLVETFLEESVGLRTLRESTATPLTPIKSSPEGCAIPGGVDSKRFSQGRRPSVRKSPNLSRYEVEIVKSSSNLRTQARARKTAGEDALVSPSAYFVEPPPSSIFTKKRESFISQLDAIARLRAWYRSGQVARFYAYDAESCSFKTYPRGRELPSVQETKNSNLTFQWLPTFEEGRSITTEGSSIPAKWDAANCLDSGSVREADVKGKGNVSWGLEADEHHDLDHISEMNRALLLAWQDYESNLQKQEDIQKESLLKPSIEAAVGAKCLPGCARIGSYDMETYFLAPGPFNIDTPGSSLVNEAISLDNKEDMSLLEELLPAECEVDSDFARSFLGSQFSESRAATPVDSFKIYGELMESEDAKDLLLPTPTGVPRVTKTFFDLAREYAERHPYILSSRSSENLEVPKNESSAKHSRPGSKLYQSIDSLEEPSENDFGSAFDDESDKEGSETTTKPCKINRSTLSEPQEPCITARPSFEHVENIEEVEAISNGSNIATGLVPNFVDKSWISISLGEGSSRRSSISYTSHLESEKMPSRLFRDPYPHDTCLGDEDDNHNLGTIGIPTSTVDKPLRSSSINSFASGFKFSTFANQLLEAESRRMSSDSSDDELCNGILSVPISLDLVNNRTFEEQRPPSSDTTNRDFDARPRVPKNEAHPSPLATDGRQSVGALVNIFQARSLIPQSPKSPFNKSQSTSPYCSEYPLLTNLSAMPQSSQETQSLVYSPKEQEVSANRRDLQRMLARSIASDATTEEISNFGADLKRSNPKPVNDTDTRTT
ncbi:hypothetical protein BJ875DRAFT_479452 [Amylocarpus encephaloides]|uniref:Uncharacterized protein n=1 Tax=Amylocarpus encephaloides TaxID=45428 RepID=A0A9P8CBM1_9HELO|nr:hypothetical protein BJ875DRAFT_479452 [Amylocarpus encephaloides]